MPLGSAEGSPFPQALQYLLAHGRDAQVRLADVHDELSELSRELDSLEADAIIDELRIRLDKLGDAASVRDVARRLEGMLADQRNPAAVDVAAFVATRLLKYIR